MSHSEMMQLKLPRAMDLGNTQVAAREFPLTIFANQQNYYTDLYIHGARIIPNFAPVQVFVYSADVERGRYASHDGRLDFDLHVTDEEPAVLKFYNLSVDTEVMVSMEIIGGLHNAVQRE